ncbi:hypothetical protein D3C87_243230 [compost metagenome]
MKMHYLPVLFIGLMTILCPKLAEAQIVKWDLTSVPSGTTDGGASDIFKVATTINGNTKTDANNGLNNLRRGAGLRNTTSGTRVSLARGFSSTSTVKDGDFSTALNSNLYFEFYVSAKVNNYLHANSLVATIRRSSISTVEGVNPGLQWTYRLVDEADLSKVEDANYNLTNPFKNIGSVITGYDTSEGVQNITPINIEELKNVPADKTAFFRLYVWGFANNTTNTFAVRSLSGSTALSLEGTVDGTLPVELKGFRAKSVSQGVQLAWQTVSETNNSHFDVLKVNGQKTEKIGEVKGAGNSQTTKDYSFLDIKPTAGINYYQLRQVDFNGDQSLSEVTTARVGFDHSDLVAYTNGNQVIIDAYADVKGTAEVVLNDMSGKTLLKKKVTLNAGKNSFSFPVNLTKGTYIATVFSGENGKAAQKFIY